MDPGEAPVLPLLVGLRHDPAADCGEPPLLANQVADVAPSSGLERQQADGAKAQKADRRTAGRPSEADPVWIEGQADQDNRRAEVERAGPDP
jgi:hypothetical protein